MPTDLNILSYIIYLPIMSWITVRVGKALYENGKVWCMELYQDKAFVDAINKILLLGYYLVNLGYVILMVAFWEHITDLQHMVQVLSERIGGIMLLLAALHYFNIAALTVWRNKQFKPSKQNDHG